MTAADVLRQAEELKAATQDTSRSANEAWVSRQALQDVYQKLLVMDLEFALDKKIEQELWNHAFKNQISTLQNQAKDKQSQKRGEVQASLNLFLETASGFYLQLLQELCCTFNLDLPFRKKASCFGIMKEYGPISVKIKLPKRSSCMYICQHCLVHLGDIARYRQQTDQAQAFYRHAARLVPYNGQPYNQLAILDAAKGNKLSTVFYYVRSIAVKHPFPVAATNLEKLYAKISKDSHDYRSKLTSSDLVSIFLQLHTFVHLCTCLSRAKSHVDKILVNLPPTVALASFSSYQLVQMIAINLFALYHGKRRLSDCRIGAGEPGENNMADCRNNMPEMTEPMPRRDQQQEAYDLMFAFTVSVFESLLQVTPKQESKVRESPTLPALKVIFDWLRSDPDLLSDPAFSRAMIWLNVAKLLNVIQTSKDSSVDLQKYAKTPLPEDSDLECFLPVNKALSELDFYSAPGVDVLSEEMEVRLRCQRLVAAGFWVAEEFPSLNLLNVHRLPSGKLEFSTQLQVASTENGDEVTDIKSTRQNVATQAILQKNVSVSNGTAPNQILSKTRDEVGQKSAASVNVRHGRTSRKEAEDSVPERSDAGIMANTVHPDTSRPGEPSMSWTPVSSSPAGVATFNPSVRPPFPFPNQIPGAMFHQIPHYVDPRPVIPPTAGPRAASSGSIPAGIYDGMYGPPPPASFVPRFMPGMPPPDMRLPPPVPVGRGIIMESEVVRNSSGGSYDMYGGYHPSQHPVGSPKMYQAGQPMGYMSSQSGPSTSVYLTRADGSGFSNPVRFQMAPSGIATSTPPQQWQGQVPPRPFPIFQMPGMPSTQLESGGGFNAGRIPPTLQTSMLPPPGGGMSCVSPDLELMEVALLANQRTSPQHLSSAVNFTHFNNSPSPLIGRDVPEMILSPGGGAVPFTRSPPIDSLQLSRSLPATVKFGGLQPGLVGSDSGFGPTSRSPFDNTPNPLNSIYQSNIDAFYGRDEKTVGYKPMEEMMSPSSLSKSNTVGFGFSSQHEKRSSTGNLSSSSLFTNSDDDRQEVLPLVTSTYTLFGQEPWPVGISSSSQGADSNSLRSSPFESSTSGSLRATPDPYLSDDRSSVTGGGYGLGGSLFGRPSVGTAGMASSSGGSTWKNPAMDSTVGSGRVTAADAGIDMSTLTANMQSLWSGGPSPLEKLLEQQKQQRQSTPR